MSEKQPKDMVDYGPGDVDGPHCGACIHFIEPNHCEVVSGRIRSGGWSRLYEPKAGAPKEDERKDVKKS